MSMDIKDLRELRIQLGISYEEVGKWLQVSCSTVCAWEKGRKKPSSESLFNYEQFLQDVIDGKIKPKISQNAGRSFQEESKQRALAEEQVTIGDVLPELHGETDIKKLREQRIRLGIPLKEVAKWLNVSRACVGFWETGVTKISSANFSNYKQFLQDVIDGKINVKTYTSAEHEAGKIKTPIIADAISNLPGGIDIKELKKLRIQLGLPQREVETWLKVSRNVVGSWESGRHKPSSKNLIKYKQFLQDVADGKVNPKRSNNAGRNYSEEHRQQIADIVPAVPKTETPITPKYYKGKNGIEAIDFIEAFNLNFNCGNVIKYVTRAGKKTEKALEDLQKAHWYLEREIERIRVKS